MVRELSTGAGNQQHRVDGYMCEKTVGHWNSKGKLHSEVEAGDHEFKASLDYLVNPRTVKTIRTVLTGLM